MPFGWLILAFSITLNLLVLFYLWRSSSAIKYRSIGLFCIAQLVLIAADYAASTFTSRDTYTRTYWLNDIIAHMFISLVIVALIRAALEEYPQFRWAPTALFLGVLVVAAVSLIVFQNPRIPRWINPVSRNLSLTEEALNLVLWALLLRRQQFDVQLLLLSAGMVMQVTGEVIGLTLRPYTNATTIWVPNLLVQFSELLCLGIWIWALRYRPRQHVGT
ncbi:MAG: hypothetical protein JO022_16565 [Acidobacteriaceae bacterium]|nr:hypothetical protein [Acidobacteriaceae bacterium]